MLRSMVCSALQKRKRRGGDMYAFGDLDRGAEGKVAAPDARVNDA